MESVVLFGEKEGDDWPAYESDACSRYNCDSQPWIDANRVVGRHNDGFVFTYADGHSKWIRFGQDVAPKNHWLLQ